MPDFDFYVQVGGSASGPVYNSNQLKDNIITCLVQNDGILKNRKGINVPSTKLSMPFISEKDYKFYTVRELENNKKYQESTSKKLGGYFDIRKNEHIREYK